MGYSATSRVAPWHGRMKSANVSGADKSFSHKIDCKFAVQRIVLLPIMEFKMRWREIEVYLPCTDEYLPEDQVVEFLNIEEDFEGRDVLTFKCPRCLQVHKSQRFN